MLDFNKTKYTEEKKFAKVGNIARTYQLVWNYLIKSENSRKSITFVKMCKSWWKWFLQWGDNPYQGFHKKANIGSNSALVAGSKNGVICEVNFCCW